jgi:hypothetical protein
MCESKECYFHRSESKEHSLHRSESKEHSLRSIGVLHIAAAARSLNSAVLKSPV